MEIIKLIRQPNDYRIATDIHFVQVLLYSPAPVQRHGKSDLLLIDKNNTIMRDRIAITISDSYGSKHFSIGKPMRYIAIGSLFTIWFGFIISAGTNYFQHNNNTAIKQYNVHLQSTLISAEDQNSKLTNIITIDKQLIDNIKEKLIQIEKLSGVDSEQEDITLERRIHRVAAFYNQQEDKYAHVDIRMQQIEELVGLEILADTNEGGILRANDGELIDRMDLLDMTIAHKKILHASIPNGFPTETQVVTSKYGNRIHPLTKIKTFHRGIDLRAKTKDKVFATADGIVKKVEYTKEAGNRLILQHNFGFETRYSHLDSAKLEAGEIVHKGDLIALSGNTGRSASPHLHYEIRYLGKSVDPYQFLKWEFGSDAIFTKVKGIKWPSLVNLINKQITPETLLLSQLAPALQEK